MSTPVNRRHISQVPRVTQQAVGDPESVDSLFWGLSVFDPANMASSSDPLADFSFSWPQATGQKLIFAVEESVHQDFLFEIDGQLVSFPSTLRTVFFNGQLLNFVVYESEFEQFGTISAVIRVQ